MGKLKWERTISSLCYDIEIENTIFSIVTDSEWINFAENEFKFFVNAEIEYNNSIIEVQFKPEFETFKEAEEYVIEISKDIYSVPEVIEKLKEYEDE